MIDRDEALRILGLPASASESEIRDSWRLVRDHVRARAAASTAQEFQSGRESELRELADAVGQLTKDAAAELEGSDGRSKRRRWLIAWATVATVVAVVSLTFLAMSDGARGPAVLVDGAGDGGSSFGEGVGYALEGDEEAEAGASGGGGDAEVEDAGPRARIVALSDVEGAQLEITQRSGDGEAALVAEGAADDTAYWLSPGEFEIRVSHPDCPDDWQETVAVEGGEELELAPEICTGTGWVVVRSNVHGDKLSIDSVQVGETGPGRHPVTSGEHEIRVEKPGYETWEGVVVVEPGHELGIRPRLARAPSARPDQPRPPVAQPSGPPGQSQVAANRARGAEGEAGERASARGQPGREDGRLDDTGWHVQVRQWVLSRYDLDLSGSLDTREEVYEIPCDQWLGLERSHDASGLAIPLTRFYGFDGEGWVDGSLGVSSTVRDIAYDRMRECGLR